MATRGAELSLVNRLSAAWANNHIVIVLNALSALKTEFPVRGQLCAAVRTSVLSGLRRCFFIFGFEKIVNVNLTRSLTGISVRSGRIFRRRCFGNPFGLKGTPCNIHNRAAHRAAHHESAYCASDISHSAFIARKLLGNYHLALFRPRVAFYHSAGSSFLCFAHLFIIGFGDFNGFHIEMPFYRKR